MADAPPTRSKITLRPEPLVHDRDIDPLARVVQFEQMPVEHLMGLVVEVLGATTSATSSQTSGFSRMLPSTARSASTLAGRSRASGPGAICQPGRLPGSGGPLARTPHARRVAGIARISLPR
jgi:hypothetical protein